MVVFRTAVRRMLGPGSLLICRTEWSAVSPGWHSWHRRRRRFGRAQAGAGSELQQCQPVAAISVGWSLGIYLWEREAAAACGGGGEGGGGGRGYIYAHQPPEYTPSIDASPSLSLSVNKSVNNRRQRQRQRTWLSDTRQRVTQGLRDNILFEAI
jgi:hypothetical protein